MGAELTNRELTRIQTTNGLVYQIDLPTTLRLAGARNLDVQIARERVNEAQANRQSAVEQFFPWIAPGVTYHRRDGVAQAVPSGVISDAHFQSYSPGVALTAQVNLGDAIYSTLAAKQLVKVSEQAMAGERLVICASAAQTFFELAKAKALIETRREAIKVSGDYQRQLHDAVSAGVAFRGDELRVQSQTEHFQLELEQATAQRRLAGVELAQILHLDPAIELFPTDEALVPVSLFPTNKSLDSFVREALTTRPELKQSMASMAALQASKKGVVYGPLIPSLGAQAFGGGLGGGPDSGPSHFAAEGDYNLGISWRLGPGGLLDPARMKASNARLAAAQLGDAKVKDLVTAEVVSAVVRMESIFSQIHIAERNLATATEAMRLTRERKAFGVGVVLEDIDAQQALTRARSDYVSAVAEYDKAQFELGRAVGGFGAEKRGTETAF